MILGSNDIDKNLSNVFIITFQSYYKLPSGILQFVCLDLGPVGVTLYFLIQKNNSGNTLVMCCLLNMYIYISYV